MKGKGLFFLCLLPLLRILWQGACGKWGVNPVEFLERSTGDWSLDFLCFTLAAAPAARLGLWRWRPEPRRTLGLFAAFYAALHSLVYFVFDASLGPRVLLADCARRPALAAGLAALVILGTLAATSTDASRRALGPWWPRLHRLVYAAAALAVFHYYGLMKSDIRRPLRYAAAIAALIAYRVLVGRQRRGLLVKSSPG